MGLIGLLLAVLVSLGAVLFVRRRWDPRLRALARSRPVMASVASILLLTGFLILADVLVDFTLGPWLREGFEARPGYVWSRGGGRYSMGHVVAILSLYLLVALPPIGQLRVVSELITQTVKPRRFSLFVVLTIGAIILLVYYWLFSDVLPFIWMILIDMPLSVLAFWFWKAVATCVFAIFIFQAVFRGRAEAKP